MEVNIYRLFYVIAERNARPTLNYHFVMLKSYFV